MKEAFIVIVKPSNSINMFEVTRLWIVLHVLILRREWTINSSSFFLVFLHLWSCGSAPDAYIGVSTVAFCNGEHPTPPGARTIQSYDAEYAEHRPHADPAFIACRVNSGHSWRVFSWCVQFTEVWFQITWSSSYASLSTCAVPIIGFLVVRAEYPFYG